MAMEVVILRLLNVIVLIKQNILEFSVKMKQLLNVKVKVVLDLMENVVNVKRMNNFLVVPLILMKKNALVKTLTDIPVDVKIDAMLPPSLQEKIVLRK